MAVKTGSLDRGLWPESDIDPAPGSGAVARYVVVGPGTGRHIILPLDNRHAAAEAIAQPSGDTSATDTAKRAAVRTALRLGLLQPLLRTRFSVRVASQDPTVPTLHEYLARAVGLPDVVLAVRFGPIRPNQKPIVRIMEGTGQTVAFAKVGWNDLTRELVDHEAGFLSGIDRSALREITVPEVLHHGDWNDHRVLVLRALRLSESNGRTRPPTAAEYREIAALGGPIESLSLAGSPYWSDLAERVAYLPVKERETARSMHASIEKDARSDLWDFGRWHGDLTPWNVNTTTKRLLVWDWERTRRPAPLGLDAIHFAMQPRFSRDGLSASRSLAVTESATSGVLTDLGIRTTLHPLLRRLYLLELFARFGKAASDGDDAAAAICSSIEEALGPLTV